MPTTFDQVDAIARKLPDVTVVERRGNRAWMIRERGFAWERPLNKADLKRLGDAAPPEGPLLAVRVESLDAKEALLAIGPPGFFTIEHFNGFAAVLIQLKKARVADVRTAIEDAYRVMAEARRPKKRARKPAAR